jgi:peptide/nickel transport system permease protein
VAKSGSSLRAYLVARVLLAIPMVWILLTLVFLLLRVAPGDPITAALGGQLPPAELARRRHAAGYDRPIIVQYGDYLKQVLTGNLGKTQQNESVTHVVLVNGSATLELSLFALLFALVVGVPVGLRCGRRRDGAFDTAGRLFGIITYAAPVFFLGLLFQLLFTKKLGWLPPSGQVSPTLQAEISDGPHLLFFEALFKGDMGALGDVVKHLIMPAVTLGLLLTGVVIRLVRVNVIQTLKGDYIEAARARGIPERRVVMRHAFHNALVPIITVMGLQAALLLSGSVLTEETFNWPGIGNRLIQYLQNRDYLAVQGIISVFAIVVVIVSLLIDIANAILDPRVRY